MNCFCSLSFRTESEREKGGMDQFNKQKINMKAHPITFTPSPPLPPPSLPPFAAVLMLNNICAAAEAADSMQRFVAASHSAARSLHPQLCARRKMNLHRNRKISKRRAGGELITRATSNPQTASNIHFLPAPGET